MPARRPEARDVQVVPAPISRLLCRLTDATPFGRRGARRHLLTVATPYWAPVRSAGQGGGRAVCPAQQGTKSSLFRSAASSGTVPADEYRHRPLANALACTLLPQV